jgi:hypothetical protein
MWDGSTSGDDLGTEEGACVRLTPGYALDQAARPPRFIR